MTLENIDTKLDAFCNRLYTVNLIINTNVLGMILLIVLCNMVKRVL